MRSIEYRRIIWSSIFALSLSTAGAVSPAFAQGTGDAGTQMRTEDVEDDQDWGWIGLLGLAGLLGLRRRDRVDHVDSVRTRP